MKLEEDILRVGTEVVRRVVPQDIAMSEAIKYRMWTDIRNRLMAYPRETQTSFMERLIGPQGTNFPNGEKIARTYVEVINNTWSQPEAPDQNWIVQMTASHLRALEIPFISSRLKQRDWRDAMNRTDMAMRRAARENDRGEYSYVTRQMHRLSQSDSWQLYEILLNRGLNAFDFNVNFAPVIERELEWVVVEDLMPQYGYPDGNPFEPLRKLYQAGLIVRGISGGSFRVDRPQIQQAA